MDHVVTAFVRHRGRILLVRRSDRVGTYRGKWAGVSGYVEGDPEMTRPDAERELDEEVGFLAPEFVASGEPLNVVDDDNDLEWTVHPYLFRVDDPGVEPNEEVAEYEWVPPTAILERECVPALWETYRRVSPSLADVVDDETHGSAHISARALETLRDAAGEAAHAGAIVEPEFDSWGDVADLARELRDARPAMAAVSNRVNRAMARADDLESLVDQSQAVLEAALDADDEAAGTAADLLAEASGEASPMVATLSRSGTVTTALHEAEPAVVVAESRPGGEGVDVAEGLVDAGLDVTLVADAALAAVVAGDVGDDSFGPPDAALVGADSVLADGDVVNKVGTRALGLACRREAVPLYVVAARDKVAPAPDGGDTEAGDGPDDGFVTEFADAATVYDGEAPLDVLAPVFDRTPNDCVAGVVTEDGVLDTEGVRAVAAEHREHAGWDG